MGRLRDLDRAVERRWPWLGNWGNLSLATHVRYVMRLLAAGQVTSLVLYAVASPHWAWTVGCATLSMAFAATFHLRRRLKAAGPAVG